MSENGKILIVVAHPDDPEFSCGGSVGFWTRQGREVIYLICSRGQKGTSDPAMTTERLAVIREDEQRAAARVLGVSEVAFLDHVDGELEPTLRLRKDVTRAIRFYRPYAVVTHDPTTLIVGNEFINHPDHRAVGLATVDAIYPTARDRLQFPEHLSEGLEPHRVVELYLFASDNANFWVDVTDTMELKLAAIRKHASQIGKGEGLDERVRARAKLQGASQGLAMAEAYRRVVMRR